MDITKTIVIVLSIFLPWSEGYVRLNDYISHYEALHYDASVVHSNHLRSKRSVQNAPLVIKFHAHGRHFNLKLHKDTSTFHKNFRFELPGGELTQGDTSHIYEGKVKGDDRSYVHGSVLDGVFAGRIRVADKTYHVDRAELHFEEPQKFHSVIYQDNHVETDPYRDRRERHHGGCGNEAVRDWMDSHVPVDDATKAPPSAPSSPSSQAMLRSTGPLQFDNGGQVYRGMYSAAANRAHHRSRRATDPNVNKRTCTLFLQSDTMLWDRMTLPQSRGGLGYSDSRARDEISSLFASHVSGLKDIYENARFAYKPKDYAFTGISFSVLRVKINETRKDCPQGGNTRDNPFCQPNIDVSNFLNLNSLRNHDDFCLAYVFTYRDFTGGTLGLAWVGSPSKASGGICETYKRYTESTRDVYKSLNTGIVSLINYNNPVPAKVSTLTFAHEHDSGSCTASDHKNGNYIMFASATSGDRPNNNKFSPCSSSNISLVLHSVFNELHGKINCFTSRETAFCGNTIVEEGEVCDCGYSEDCQDPCCHGRGHSQECKLRSSPSVQCSPTQGPCCHSNCTFVKKRGVECAMASDCTERSFCEDKNASCPTPRNKNNFTACNQNTQVCMKGECQGSICDRIGWEQCFLTSNNGAKKVRLESLCYVACSNPNRSSVCVSTEDKAALAEGANAPLRQLLSLYNLEFVKLPRGAPCDDFQGYCDVFQKCRKVDADGPLARLKNLVFNERTFHTIRNWIINTTDPITETTNVATTMTVALTTPADVSSRASRVHEQRHWWAVLLMSLGLIILMGAFIKVCAVHTPSSNPNRKKHRKISLRPPPARGAQDPRMNEPPLSRRRQQNEQQQRGPRHSGRSRSRGAPLHPRDQRPVHVEDVHVHLPNRMEPYGPPPPYSSRPPPQGQARSADSNQGRYELHEQHGHGPRAHRPRVV